MTHQQNENQLYFHGCPYSSVQSIIQFGFHTIHCSQYGQSLSSTSLRLRCIEFILDGSLKGSKESVICLTRDALTSHLYGTRRSTDGLFCLFAVQSVQCATDEETLLLSNDEAHLILPTHLILYRRQTNL